MGMPDVQGNGDLEVFYCCNSNTTVVLCCEAVRALVILVVRFSQGELRLVGSHEDRRHQSKVRSKPWRFLVVELGMDCCNVCMDCVWRLIADQTKQFRVRVTAH
jgi:hypothetical protein